MEGRKALRRSKMKGFFEVFADDGQSQVFTAEELGLDPEFDYNFDQVVEALEKIGYSRSGVVSIE